MRVLVLGGTRFIGRSIVEHLLRDGHEVTLLNRGISYDPFATRVRRIVGDRRHRDTIVKAARLRDFDAVIDVTAYHEDETATVVEAFRDRVGHFIHISTAAVYLIRDGVFPPFEEEHFAGPLIARRRQESTWAYAFHKRRCEEVLARAHSEHGFPFTSLRLPVVVGPDDYTRRADAYLERVASGGPVILPEGGLNSWGFLWVEDIAEVVTSNLFNGLSLGRAYNLAQREALSLREFVELAAVYLDRTVQILSLASEWLHAVGLGTCFSPFSHDRDILLACQAAEEDLLFRPTAAREWMQRLVDGFRQRWDGVQRAFAATRAHELELAREVARIRLPSYVTTSAAPAS
jgi:nucleoside-diphosphate-sugar epimerase